MRQQTIPFHNAVEDTSATNGFSSEHVLISPIDMDDHTLPHTLTDDPQGSTFLTYPLGAKIIKTEPPSYWESDHFTLGSNSNFHDSPFTTYTPLETYIPEPHSVRTYMNLTPGSYSLSPMLAPSPVMSEEDSALALGIHVKQEPVYFYDEGIGSSNSSAKSTPSPPITQDPRLSPVQRSGSAADSDDVDSMLPAQHMKAEESKRQCVRCGSSHTGDGHWRSEATGHWLCSGCALAPQVDAHLPEDQDSRRRRKAPASAKRAHILCSNCSTHNTSLWRRNAKGEFICNACGLYEKLHKRRRPLSMKKDTIQQRKRKPRNSEAKKKTPAALKVYNNGGAADAVPPSLALYPKEAEDMHHYQHPSHRLLSLSPVGNSNHLLFGYTPDPAYQLLPTHMHNFPSDSSTPLLHP